MKTYVMTTMTIIMLQSSTWRTDAVTFTLNLTTPYVNQTNTRIPISTASLYSAFLDQIRNDVKDSSLKYGGTNISVIEAPSRNKFLKVGFEHARGKVILGFRRDNLYLVAYVAMDNANVNRAYYFRNQINSTELTALFPEVKPANHKPLEYGEDYQSIEKNAKITDRKQLGLGIDLLISTIDKVVKKARLVRDEARFLLIAIQMTAEAVRFRYIQNLVNRNFPYKFNSTNKVIHFQLSWSKISKAIHDDCKNGVLNRDYDFGFGKVRRVKDLQMGLLMYLGKPKSSINSNSTSAVVVD